MTLLLRVGLLYCLTCGEKRDSFCLLPCSPPYDRTIVLLTHVACRRLAISQHCASSTSQYTEFLAEFGQAACESRAGHKADGVAEGYAYPVAWEGRCVNRRTSVNPSVQERLGGPANVACSFGRGGSQYPGHSPRGQSLAS